VPTIESDFPAQTTVSMHYIDVAGEGRPIVFIHGFGCAHGDWESQISALAPTHRVLACDLAGHGESTTKIAQCRVEDLGSQVSAMLSAEDITNAYIVGHSMGCRVALQACMDAPERIAGIILVDGSWMGRGDARALEAAAKHPFTEHGFSNVVTGLFEEMFLDNADVQRAHSVVARAAKMDPDVGINLFASMVAWDAREMERALSTLKAPLMLIQSTYLNTQRKRVPLTPGQSTPWLDIVREIRPDASIEIISGVGHFTMFEAPEAVNSLLDAFCAA
jgi:pimeloyl-ACP methyl ester carboxylesterase